MSLSLHFRVLMLGKSIALNARTKESVKTSKRERSYRRRLKLVTEQGAEEAFWSRLIVALIAGMTLCRNQHKMELREKNKLLALGGTH